MPIFASDVLVFIKNHRKNGNKFGYDQQSGIVSGYHPHYHRQRSSRFDQNTRRYRTQAQNGESAQRTGLPFADRSELWQVNLFCQTDEAIAKLLSLKTELASHQAANGDDTSAGGDKILKTPRVRILPAAERPFSKECFFVSGYP